LKLKCSPFPIFTPFRIALLLQTLVNSAIPYICLPIFNRPYTPSSTYSIPSTYPIPHRQPTLYPRPFLYLIADLPYTFELLYISARLQHGTSSLTVDWTLWFRYEHCRNYVSPYCKSTELAASTNNNLLFTYPEVFRGLLPVRTVPLTYLPTDF
jgi:hypothetical protein